MTDCEHIWVSNSGRGGAPDFRSMGGQFSPGLRMHVTCAKCNARTWLSRLGWNEYASIGRATEKP